MHRLFGLLIVSAVGLGLYMLLAGSGAEHARARELEGAPIAYSGWAIGLLMGLIAAWLLRVDWASVPAHLAVWLKLQRRRVWLALWGGVFAGILLLF